MTCRWGVLLHSRHWTSGAAPYRSSKKGSSSTTQLWPLRSDTSHTSPVVDRHALAQTAVCNRHHALDKQLCRWLLLSIDRLQGDELKMTQELIANMLGVRREGVTEAAGKLQEAGLIKYRRGRITVLDRARLEKRVCECYAVVKREYDRLLPYKNPRPARVRV